MDEFVKKVIEETFASKKQQRLFYAKANDESLPKKERKKWSKWAKEFSSETDFDKIPDEVKEVDLETDIDEIVDEKGNIKRKKTPENKDTEGGYSVKKVGTITDKAAKTAHGSMGKTTTFGVGHTSLRYWAESDMSKSLGYDDTMGKDLPYDDAEDHFEDDLGMTEPEAKERIAQIGYDEKLPDDKVRLIENPKTFMRDYVESVLKSRTKPNDILDSKDSDDKNVNPIIKRQIKSLKNTLTKNNLTLKDVKNLFDSEDE